MHIAYHLGAHCTDEGLLAEHLWHHRATLAQDGCHVLPPNALDAAMRAALSGNQSAAHGVDVPQDMARVVISQPDLLGPLHKDNLLYPQAIDRVDALLNLFPDQDASLHLGLRHPATLLGGLAQAPDRMPRMQSLSWFDLIAAIRKSQPTVPIILWRDEDSPYLWDHILSRLTGLTLEQRPDQNRRLERIMQSAGFSRLTGYLAANTSLDESQRRQVTAAFLSKFAQPEVVEQDISLHGWTEAELAKMDRLYLEDVARLRSLSHVTMLGI